ncbi:unnamed protein product [Dibothriocephalus latus]|uniref:Uncharacterized protein n=1 Tax=Dibothriocephalus latus TaxID=60516 RepID=A0A3P7LSB7_DIBLA|nr:unnamed protein product [Dibothriocephalus latus]
MSAYPINLALSVIIDPKKPLGSPDAHIDEDPGTLVTVGVCQHGREHETEKGRYEDIALLHSIGHCKGFGDHSVARDARHHPVVELAYPMSEMVQATELLHDFPESSAIHRVKRFR